MKEKYKDDYKDYSEYGVVMISTDQNIFQKDSAVRERMLKQARFYRELHIVVFSKENLESQKISENCNVYSTNSFSKLTYISDAKKIGKKIVENFSKNSASCPVLISCQDPFETGLVGVKLLKFIKRKGFLVELLIQIHTDLLSPYFTSKNLGLKNYILNKIRLKISESVLPIADSVRVVSGRIADSLVERGFDPNKIIIKPIEINTKNIENAIPSFSLKERFPQFQKIILMVSRLEPEKNISLALKALKLVLAQKPDAGLVIVGSGKELERLKKMAYKLKIEPYIVFVGWQDDLVSYYKGCDIFLVTSWYEGYGMTLKEAKIAGCKIVSTDVGIAKDVGADIVGWSKEEVALGLERNF